MLRGPEIPRAADPAHAVRAALAAPIGCAPLRDVAAQKQPYLNTLSSMHTDQHPVLGFVRSCKKLAAAQRKRDDDAASAAPGRKPIAGAAPGGGGAPNEN